MFDYKAMCRDVASSLWMLYHGRPDAPLLILPSKRDGVLRVSEQESKIIITQWLESNGVHYSIETPTVCRYQQSGQAQISARIDVTAYGSRDAANRVMNIELKAGTSSLEAFRKDFEKLLCENLPGLWFHTLESASSVTWSKLAEKVDEAFQRLAPTANYTQHSIWFAFCVLDTPQLTQFEIDLKNTRRGQFGSAMELARKNVLTPPYRVFRPARIEASTHPSQTRGTKSFRNQRKLLIYAPSIDTSTFLHLSIKGESYALRAFPVSGLPRRWVLDGIPTTSELTARHRFVYAINVAHERKSLEGEPNYWRNRIAQLNRHYRIS